MIDFYENLRHLFHALREAQIVLDKCVSNVTGLMEQAAHMSANLEDIPPLVAEEGPANPNQSAEDLFGSIAPSSSFAPTSPQWVPTVLTSAPVGLSEAEGVRYDTPSPCSYGALIYE